MHIFYQIMRFWLCVFFLFIPFILNAQIVTTVAGNGISSNTGDNGPATVATILAPIGGIFDRHGNYFVASSNGCKIRKIDNTGIITTIVGSSTVAGSFSGDGAQATAAGLYLPQAIAFDTIGNMYIADAYNNRIRKVNAMGIISTIAGNGGIGIIGDGGPATASNLYDPLDICFDKMNNLYIAESPHFVVRKVDPSGMISTFAGIPDSSGFSGDGEPATMARLSQITGICFDDLNNLYIADAGNGRVRKVSSSGIISTVAGIGGPTIYSGDNGPATAAAISVDKVAVDKVGNLCVNRQHKVDQI
jgi:hypothetical protein